MCVLGWFLFCVKSRCWFIFFLLSGDGPVLSCPVLCSQRVNGAVCEYGLPAGLGAGAGEAVWDAEPSSGGGAEVVRRHLAPPPPQHAGNAQLTTPLTTSTPPYTFLPSKCPSDSFLIRASSSKIIYIMVISSLLTGWIAADHNRGKHYIPPFNQTGLKISACIWLKRDWKTFQQSLFEEVIYILLFFFSWSHTRVGRYDQKCCEDK